MKKILLMICVLCLSSAALAAQNDTAVLIAKINKFESAVFDYKIRANYLPPANINGMIEEDAFISKNLLKTEDFWAVRILPFTAASLIFQLMQMVILFAFK